MLTEEQQIKFQALGGVSVISNATKVQYFLGSSSFEVLDNSDKIDILKCLIDHEIKNDNRPIVLLRLVGKFTSVTRAQLIKYIAEKGGHLD